MVIQKCQQLSPKYFAIYLINQAKLQFIQNIKGRHKQLGTSSSAWTGF